MCKTLSARCRALIACILFALSVVSCGQDGTLNGADLPGLSNPDQANYSSKTLVAYNEKTVHIRSDAPLFAKTLGVLKSPLFGLLKASFAAQLTLPERDLYFGETPVLDSVVFTAPLLKRANAKGEENPYRNDSIVGRRPDGGFKPFKVRAYEITDGMKPADDTTYSDHSYTLGNLISEVNYTPTQDSLSIKLSGETKKVAPALWIRLAGDGSAPAAKYFTEKFLNEANQLHFVNNANFRNYFKGLYLTAEGADGSLVSFDGNAAQLRIYYRNADESGLVKIFSVGRTASQVSLYEPDYDGASTDLSRQLQSPNKTQGETQLYLQGMGGPKAVVRPLSDAAFQKIKGEHWAITDARLVVHAKAAQTPLPPALALLDSEAKLIPGGTAFLNPKDHTYSFRIATYLNRRLRDSDTMGLLSLVAAKLIPTSDGTVVMSQNLPFQAILVGKAGEKPLSFQLLYTALSD